MLTERSRRNSWHAFLCCHLIRKITIVCSPRTRAYETTPIRPDGRTCYNFVDESSIARLIKGTAVTSAQSQVPLVDGKTAHAYYQQANPGRPESRPGLRPDPTRVETSSTRPDSSRLSSTRPDPGRPVDISNHDHG
jgi:hypothetical protein